MPMGQQKQKKSSKKTQSVLANKVKKHKNLQYVKERYII